MWSIVRTFQASKEGRQVMLKIYYILSTDEPYEYARAGMLLMLAMRKTSHPGVYVDQRTIAEVLHEPPDILVFFSQKDASVFFSKKNADEARHLEPRWTDVEICIVPEDKQHDLRDLRVAVIGRPN